MRNIFVKIRTTSPFESFRSFMDELSEFGLLTTELQSTPFRSGWLGTSQNYENSRRKHHFLHLTSGGEAPQAQARPLGIKISTI
jgi:hypothetical protein